MENIEMKQPAATHAKDQNQEPVASGAGNAEPDNVNTSNDNKQSPLFLAVKEGNLPWVKLLVSKKADVNVKARSTIIGTRELDPSWVVVDCESTNNKTDKAKQSKSTHTIKSN
ncbi:ankyrin repeat and SAM domain-containing protein 6-like [Strongylocentrotus purpuratus]|uniref:Uncharacterized protein n=1 Tax=Strongylocentrotus purpuratus TaxID=7668 RepID=A0A7M7PEB1_STRPU|nr:ankyrin repeat and SAM domain-containing protein 6-like [Strongylocentrotus purpuratus]